MNTFLAAIVVLIVFYIWASFSGRKLKARMPRADDDNWSCRHNDSLRSSTQEGPMSSSLR